MQLEHEFTLPISPDRAWVALLDLERVAPCMPGATLDRVEGTGFTGRVTLKVGPLRLSYRGEGQIREADETARRLVLVAAGKEAKGSGTAEATVTVTLAGAGDGTVVRLATDLALTGRAAAFGRGLISEVSDSLLAQFAQRLAHELQSGDRPEPALAAAPPAPRAAAASADASAPTPAAPAAVPAPTDGGDNVLDVLGLAKAALGGRALVAAAAAAATVVAFLLGRRTRSARSVPWPAVVVVETGRG